METSIEKIVYTYAAMATLGATAIGLYEAIAWTDLKSTDWAAWVQAIGSILAICGAILIAHQEQRSRRREAEAVGILVATEHWAALSSMEIEMVHAHRIAANAEEDGFSGDELLSLLSMVQKRHTLTSDQLRNLAGYSESCARYLAYANADLQSAEIYISRIIGRYTFLGNPPALSEHKLLVLTLWRVARLLRTANEIIATGVDVEGLNSSSR